MAQQTFTRQTVPQKGLWIAAPSDAIGPEYSPWCQNVRFRFGKVLRAAGRSTVLDTAPVTGPGAAKSFIEFAQHVDATGAKTVFGFTAPLNLATFDDISTFNPTTNKFTVVLTGRIVSLKDLRYSWTMGEEQLFVVRASRILAIGKTSTGVFDGVVPTWTSHEPTSGAALQSSTAPAACFLAYFKNHVVAGNILDGDNGPGAGRLQWSAEGNYLDWLTVNDAAGAHGGFLELYDGTVEPITGMKVLNDRLVVYRNSSIVDMNATGDPLNPFLPENRVFGIGCLLPWSLQSVGQFHIFGANDFNIYAWDGANLDPIGTPIHSYLRQLFDPGAQSGAWTNIPFAAVFMGFKEYWLVVPQSDRCVVLIYDYLRSSWTRDSFMSLTALFEQILTGATADPGFRTGYPAHYPVLMAGAGKSFFEIDDRIVGDWYGRPVDGGMDMFFDTPDMYYNPNGMLNGTLERVMTAQDNQQPVPGGKTPGIHLLGEPAYQVQVSIDRGNSFPYVQTVQAKTTHWGFEFTDLNISSNIRRYRFFYPKENGAAIPTLRAYTDVYVPSGEFFPVERPLNPPSPILPPPNIN